MIADNEALSRELSRFPEARIGAAEAVAQGLRELPDTGWLREFALTLCNDEDPRVKETLISRLIAEEGAGALHDREFLKRVLSTRIEG